LLNNTYACKNDRTLNQLLKGEMGFHGYIILNWGYQTSTLSAMAGSDLSYAFSFRAGPSSLRAFPTAVASSCRLRTRCTLMVVMAALADPSPVVICVYYN